jgi:hypothetical protein
MMINETPQGSASGLLLPWEAVNDADATKLLRELASELSHGHPLFGMKLETVARSVAADDVLFRLRDGRLAQVHLTCNGKTERLPWPVHHVYTNFAEWAEAVMLPEHDGYD